MIRLALLAIVLLIAGAVDVVAQPAGQPLSQPSRNVEIGGYALIGLMNFTAADSFDAGLGSRYGSIFGGGVRVGLPVGGLFVNAGAWRFRDSGQRVFVFNGQAFPLGIPLNVTITPIEVTGGWNFRFRRAPQVRPYVAAGLASYRYRETSEFATATEDLDEWFGGYQVAGGVEFPVQQWIGVAWEVNWTRVPNAIGESGLSAEFNEHDLGGTSFRFKITVGR